MLNREKINSPGDVIKAVSCMPYGVSNTDITGFAFTGEPRDLTGLQHHRARYYSPQLAMWASLDPWEGTDQRAMSLNGYSWVEGNTANALDPSGLSCDCEQYINIRQRFEFQDYIRCLIDIQNVSVPDKVLNSAVIIYTFLDGTVNDNATACIQGSYPASVSLGTIGSDGLYTHDHFSKPSIVDFNADQLEITSDVAINQKGAQSRLRKFSCLEFRGKNGSVVYPQFFGVTVTQAARLTGGAKPMPECSRCRL